MEKLTHNFLILLYKLIFKEETPCMLHGEMELVLEIGDWFASPGGTFLRVFGRQKSRHLLVGMGNPRSKFFLSFESNFVIL